MGRDSGTTMDQVTSPVPSEAKEECQTNTETKARYTHPILHNVTASILEVGNYAALAAGKVYIVATADRKALRVHAVRKR
jgi:hypothetical protein